MFGARKHRIIVCHLISCRRPISQSLRSGLMDISTHLFSPRERGDCEMFTAEARQTWNLIWNGVFIRMKLLCLMQVSMKAIAEKLKQFRPSATVLESEIARASRSGAIDTVGMTPANDPSNFHAVMKRKRSHHDDTIKVQCSWQCLLQLRIKAIFMFTTVTIIWLFSLCILLVLKS